MFDDQMPDAAVIHLFKFIEDFEVILRHEYFDFSGMGSPDIKLDAIAEFVSAHVPVSLCIQTGKEIIQVHAANTFLYRFSYSLADLSNETSVFIALRTNIFHLSGNS